MVIGCLFALLVSSVDGIAQECVRSEGIAVLVSPASPVAGEEFRVLLAREAGIAGIVGDFAGGALHLTAQGGGPPYWGAFRFTAGAAGVHRLTFSLDGGLHCQLVSVTDKPSPRRNTTSVWQASASWDRGFENLYSAWLEHLFLDPEGTSWAALHDLTRDPQRNLLHNHLFLGEDTAGSRGALRLQPDCADNPYFLRAYFSWKLGLPFGFFQCDRGRRNRDPSCGSWTTQQQPAASKRPARAFHLFLRKLKSAVQSGSARTALTTDHSDLYPLPLTTDALRPGTAFADPYGHTLMLVRRLPQANGRPGLLMAVDAQPDGTVTIKRFWRGNFLFATEDVIGGPGFKAFRPVVARGREFVPLTNADLANSDEFTAPSLDQQRMTALEFYDAMSRVVNPLPMRPEDAYRQLHDALYEQVLTRVKAITNGDSWVVRNPRKAISMPQGIAIFQTSGPWEDFSTPARDLRLLIALEAVLDFPNRVLRIPEAFTLPAGMTSEQMAARLRGLRAEWTAAMSFSYQRSDGSLTELTLSSLFERVGALEMGYNPNDCPEVRWGAPKGSPEASTCRRRAPTSQRRRMEKYRMWFRERRRPAWN